MGIAPGPRWRRAWSKGVASSEWPVPPVEQCLTPQPAGTPGAPAVAQPGRTDRAPQGSAPPSAGTQPDAGPTKGNEHDGGTALRHRCLGTWTWPHPSIRADRSNGYTGFGPGRRPTARRRADRCLACRSLLPRIPHGRIGRPGVAGKPDHAYLARGEGHSIARCPRRRRGPCRDSLGKERSRPEHTKPPHQGRKRGERESLAEEAYMILTQDRHRRSGEHDENHGDICHDDHHDP